MIFISICHTFFFFFEDFPKAHTYLRCDENPLGNFKCPDTGAYFKKRIILSPFPANARQIRRFLPHCTEIMRQILPMVDEVPIHIKLNVIAFTDPHELPIANPPQPSPSSNTLTRQPTAPQVPFTIYQDQPDPNPPNTDDITNDNQQDDQQSTVDSIQGGIIASQTNKGHQKIVVLNPRSINKHSLQTSLDKYFTRRSRILRLKRSMSRKSSKTPSTSHSNHSSNNISLDILPINPPLNVTINLPDTPTSKSSSSTHNSAKNSTDQPPNLQEPESVIWVNSDSLIRVDTNDTSAANTQTSIKIVYYSGPLLVEMPIIPNPAWRINPTPPRADPPHVILEIDSSSSVSRRLILKNEHDPFQLTEAALHGNLIDLTSDDNQDNDVIILSDDEELTINPIELPDPVPAISNIPDLNQPPTMMTPFSGLTKLLLPTSPPHQTLSDLGANPHLRPTNPRRRELFTSSVSFTSNL